MAGATNELGGNMSKFAKGVQQRITELKVENEDLRTKLNSAEIEASAYRLILLQILTKDRIHPKREQQILASLGLASPTQMSSAFVA